MDYICQRDKEHKISAFNKFCPTCGGRVKKEGWRCSICGKWQNNIFVDIPKFCTDCGSDKLEIASENNG